jgi:YhcH/YjgK/YiaL family protein
LEVHRASFDIQIPLSGEETYGLAEFDSAAAGSFDEAKDIGFYDQKVVPVTLNPGEFAIFYPRTCAHAPACSLSGPRRIRKIIVKVKS